MKRYIKLYEDRRNILPKTLDDWLKKVFKGDIDNLASDYDIDYEERYHFIEVDIDRDDYNTDEEHKMLLKKNKKKCLYQN